ncbi:unnamed protein product [Phytophthora lilii]|uniref:Unnamed protein product n=1 Tax=Phytophthora lilii TaxID=2077276 RepID=A0A9W6X043_9STRA|nr:unnamed protein product [Phytophthora lilii]
MKVALRPVSNVAVRTRLRILQPVSCVTRLASAPAVVFVKVLLPRQQPELALCRCNAWLGVVDAVDSVKWITDDQGVSDCCQLEDVEVGWPGCQCLDQTDCMRIVGRAYMFPLGVTVVDAIHFIRGGPDCLPLSPTARRPPH